MLTTTPNYPAWKVYIDLVQMFGTVGVAVYVWWSNREKVTSQRFTALEKEVAERVKLADLDKVREQRDRKCEMHKQDMKEFTAGNLTRLDHAEKKVERIGAEIRNLPQHRHILDLSTRIEQLHGDVHEVSGSLKGISRAVDLMNEHLINRENNMGNFADLLTSDIRLVMLRALEQDLGYSHNDSILHAILAQFGHKCSRDMVRTQLTWLQEQGLVSLETIGDTYVATVTQRGADVATGAASVPGVKRPGPRG